MSLYSPLVRRLTIRTKTGVERLRPNWAQQEILADFERQRADGKPIRNIILKARQLGVSTITEAVMFWNLFLFEHSAGLVIAHEADASTHLFGMTRLYWDYFPFKRLFSPKYLSKREIEWEETGSQIRIATAQNVGAGRGRTLNWLHASECGFWEQPEEIMLGMRQTIPSHPNTMIVLESTANGAGNWFHQTWQAACNGDVEYRPLFFPWFRHPDYAASMAGLSMPPMGRMSSEERLLQKLGADEDHLQWRRWAIQNLAGGDEDAFEQEYPATPETAFLTSGRPVFNVGALQVVYDHWNGSRGELVREGDQVRFVPDRLGRVTIFRKPSKDVDWGQYMIGGDAAHAGGHDYAVAQVINRRQYEQVAVWRGRIDPASFGEELAKLGMFYNEAEIAPEVEGPGYATVGRLIGLEYPNLWRHRWADREEGAISPRIYGWSTNVKRKDWAISNLAKLVLDRSILIHDRGTFEEMLSYVNLPEGGYGPAARDGFDDRVMALAIACIAALTEPVLAYESRAYQDEREPVAAAPAAWESWE